MKSISFLAPAALPAPQDAGELDLPEAAREDDTGGGQCRLLPAKKTSAGGLDAYETTTGRFPLLPAAPEKRCSYASVQPAVDSTSFARSLLPVVLQPFSP